MLSILAITRYEHRAKPTALHTSKKGIRITFTTPLDKSFAQDPENYGIKAFNIKVDYAVRQIQGFLGTAPKTSAQQ